MFHSILVPLDGSTFGEHALPLAVTIAKKANAQLRLLYVYPPSAEVLMESSPFYDEELQFKIKTKQRAYLDGVVDRLKNRFTNIEIEIAEGEVAETIRKRAVEDSADLVVMATHARGAIGRFFLGSVADELVRTLPMPLLLVRPHDAAVDLTSEVPLNHMLLPLDGSPFAEQMIAPAQELAKLMGSDMTLLRVVQPVPVVEPVPIELGAPPIYTAMAKRLDEAQQDVLNQARAYVEQIASRMQVATKTARMHVVEDLPADEILRQASPGNVDLVALATHGRRGLSRFVLGSVADKVIRGARVPVLVLRPKSA